MSDPDRLRAWYARWRLVQEAQAQAVTPRSAGDKLAAVSRLRTFGRLRTRGRGDDEPSVWERFATLRARHGHVARR